MPWDFWQVLQGNCRDTDYALRGCVHVVSGHGSDSGAGIRTGASVATVTIVIGVLGWPKFARLIYGNVLSAREQDYVEAARAIGTKDGTILTKYILPNTFAPVLISFTFRAAQAIITESA